MVKVVFIFILVIKLIQILLFFYFSSLSASHFAIALRAIATLEIGQNSHDLAVLWMIKKYLNAEGVEPKSVDEENYLLESAKAVKGLSRFIVSNTSYIHNIIIPFFNKYSLLTDKSLDYLDWKELIEMKSKKLHLTSEGLNKMRLIKSKMKNSFFE